ncbi:MAG: class I SAM-dependent methyltransferase [Anaerolineae bacterium]|nr:class I SAM-dependent methyltransferase [Anaerolineae bacterium]
MSTPLYDQFSTDYDRFVNWDKRLAGELPFIERQLEAVRAKCVLDVACGTGRHVIALAQRGYQVVGVDVSAGMIARARQNAQIESVDVEFIVAGFGELAPTIEERFDAVLCLGSSLPHIASMDDLAPTLRDFAAVLRPGGLLILQNRNFDRVLLKRDRWMPPQSYRESDTEWLFLRFYDFNADGSFTFNVATLRRQSGGPWQQQVESTALWPLQAQEILVALQSAGFESTTMFGDMQGASFAPEASPNIVVTAQRIRPSRYQK